MTCRDKYVLDNATEFAAGVIPPGCPDDYGYLRRDDVSDEFGYCIRSCKACWDMVIPETDEITKLEFIRTPKEIEKENERLIAENTRLKAELEKLVGRKD